MEINFIY